MRLEATPVKRNNPPNSRKIRLDEELWLRLLALWQVVVSPNHAFSILVIFSPSANVTIPRDTSPVKGESLGKTCQSTTAKMHAN
jgi:hypothetical protein